MTIIEGVYNRGSLWKGLFIIGAVYKTGYSFKEGAIIVVPIIETTIPEVVYCQVLQ